MTQCEATVSKNWSTYRCAKPGTALRQGRTLCTIHAKRYDGWEESPERDASSMAKFWWGWPAEFDDLQEDPK